MQSEIGNGIDVIHELERRLHSVVGLLAAWGRDVSPAERGFTEGLRIECHDGKHAWRFYPQDGSKHDARLWTLGEHGQIVEAIYELGQGTAPEHVELAYDLLGDFVQGMSQTFPKFEERLQPFLNAAKRKMPDGTIA